MPIKCVAVMGATATGKSAAAIALAKRLSGEVVSMDSRQVYRGLDIGTGKVTADERGEIPHHLIDVADPHETWNAARHADAAEQCVAAIVQRGRLPLLVGGTGLYFRALLGGLVDVRISDDVSRAIRSRLEARDTADLYDELSRRDARRAAQLAPADRVRIVRALEIIEFTGRPVSELYGDASPESTRYEALRVVLTMSRARLRARVAERTRALFAAGWADEVRGLLGAGVPPGAPAMTSLGYGDIAAALTSGEGESPELIARVITATQQYAKRQETFFRGEGGAAWLDVTEPAFGDRLFDLVRAHLGG